MKSFEFEGIGTHWHIEIFDETQKFENLKFEIISVVNEFQNTYSRFLDTSLVGKLNSTKILENPTKELLTLFKISEEAKSITNGHFDIAVGRVLENMGYDAEYSFSQKENLVDNTINISSSKITLSENTRIDFGGIGKGFLIDKVRNYLNTQKIKYYLINAGGDIYATSEFNKPIEFVLENPFDITQMIGTISIKNQSIASSSNARRKWKTKNNKEFNHLIDMKKKANIEEVAAVFTLAQNAFEADIASTCLFVSNSSLYNNIAKFYNTEFLIIFSDQSFIKSANYPAQLFS